jgi:hypothetical protein
VKAIILSTVAVLFSMNAHADATAASLDIQDTSSAYAIASRVSEVKNLVAPRKTGSALIQVIGNSAPNTMELIVHSETGDGVSDYLVKTELNTINHMSLDWVNQENSGYGGLWLNIKGTRNAVTNGIGSIEQREIGIQLSDFTGGAKDEPYVNDIQGAVLMQKPGPPPPPTTR